MHNSSNHSVAQFSFHCSDNGATADGRRNANNSSTLRRVVEEMNFGDEQSPIYISRTNRRKFTSNKSYRRGVKRFVCRRLIRKNGSSSVLRSETLTLLERYIRDFANTLVDSSWHWTIICLSSCFVLSWVIFACIWMLISNANGDVDLRRPSTTPCLSGIQGFGGFVMFSIETQQTIGYGSRYINHYCPEGTFLMCLQIIFGCAICGAMVSIVNAKMVRPLQFFSKNLFSKTAVIMKRDSEYCLIFRVRDENCRYAMGTTINAYLVQSRPPGEPFLKSLTLEPYGLLIWPLDIVHKIDRNSPLYDLSAYDLINKRFEIIATMHGTSTVTGQCSKTRTSYLSTEISWGYKFKPCVSYNTEEHCYWIDDKEFNKTEEDSLTLCSAARLEEVVREMPKDIHQSFYKVPVDGNETANSDEESLYDNVGVEEEEEEDVKVEDESDSRIDLEELLVSLDEQLRTGIESLER